MSNPAAKVNPANLPDTKNPGKDRIPMSVPQRHLELPDIPGYHTHWFMGSNVSRALRASYTFVTEEDGVDVNNFDLAGNATASGNSDLGTRISIPAAVGGDSEERLYAMKLPLELWEEDCRALEKRNEKIAAALRGEREGALEGKGNPYDTSNVTKNQMASNLFTPKRKL